MAASPAHQFGQIIGDVLEAAVLPMLERFAQEHRLYLDRKGSRACRSGKKCTWKDSNGNAHDLDFVLERGGTPETLGKPVAFIETAWRRYTKHSRNKAQEIQGALEPLAQTYRTVGPFKGAILAGVFTEGALAQLRSLGFTVLYIPYDAVVSVFQQFGIDAAFDEATPDREFRAKVRAFKRISAEIRSELAAELIRSHSREATEFLQSLRAVVSRNIDRVVVLVLHGRPHTAPTIDAAIDYIREYRDLETEVPIERFEVQLRYTNGDEITGCFQDKSSAIAFLQGYLAH